MKTKASIQTEIIIEAEAQTVWNILTDTSAYKDWNPFIVSMSGVIKEGERLTNVMKNGNSTLTFKPKVLRVEENKYFEWLGNLWFPGIFDGLHYFKIEDAGSNHVKLTQGEHFSGILSGFILKKIGAETSEKFKAMNRAIKELAEQKHSL